MKLTKNNILQSASHVWRKHIHFLASLTCGFAMSMLISTQIDAHQARHFQEYSPPSVSNLPLHHSAAAAKVRPITAQLVALQTAPVVSEDESRQKSALPMNDAFPQFMHASQPVSRVPNWGAMSTPEEWGRSYSQLNDTDFVPIPPYDLNILIIPLKSLSNGDRVRPDDIPIVTAKLYYSTRYMAKYDLDANENSGNHPGVDLKLALGTPVGAIGGGRIFAVSSNARLGLHVIVEHRNESGQFFSVYAHLGSSSVSVGDTVKPGQTLGFVGLTGMTTMAHLHLEVHRGATTTADELDAAAFAGSEVINPMAFIERNGNM